MEKFIVSNSKVVSPEAVMHWRECRENGLPFVWVEHYPLSLPIEQRPFYADIRVNMTACDKGLTQAQVNEIEAALNQACVASGDERAQMKAAFSASTYRVYAQVVPREQAEALAEAIVKIIHGTVVKGLK